VVPLFQERNRNNQKNVKIVQKRREERRQSERKYLFETVSSYCRIYVFGIWIFAI